MVQGLGQTPSVAVPIWYVILVPDQTMSNTFRYSISRLHKAVKCDLSDLDMVWKFFVDPLQMRGIAPMTLIIMREPDENPFREQAVDYNDPKTWEVPDAG